MNRQAKIRWKQLRIIIICWMIMGLLITIHDWLLLNTADSIGLSEHYSFFGSAIKNISAGLIGALIGGSTLVFYVNVKFQDKPYGYTLLVVSTVFISVVILVTNLMGLIVIPMQTGKPMSDPVSKSAFIVFLKDTSHLKALIAWSFIVFLTQMLLQINSKFGQPDFWNIISGKYNRPKEERRMLNVVMSDEL